MNKFFIIMFHTYLSKLKSRAFIVTTLITLLFVFGFMNIDRIIALFETDDEPAAEVAVIDETNDLFEAADYHVQQLYDNIILVDVGENEEAALEAVERGDFNGLLILDYENGEVPGGEYYAPTVAEQSLPLQLEQALQQVKIEHMTATLDLDQETVEAIYAPVSFERTALDEGARSEAELNQARFLVYILLFVIYFSVLFLGSLIAMEVATEKSSRVMEILISSASPVKQMFGKIAGIGLLGLTQFFLIFLIGLWSFQGQPAQQPADVQEPAGGLPFFEATDLSLVLLLYAFVFFFLGYLLYATLSAMLGSIVSRIEDVNASITPVNMLVISAFFIAMFGLSSPESPIITVTSFIPFFTPMIMFLRVGMLEVPVWEVALSIVLMLAAIAFFAWVGARVYRGGVLMYGTSRSLKELRKAFKLK
ncbi:ABC transporter permease [Bacillus sp. FJAT-44742]|uniref:ABC transporter permease n=1 Tax=Bacillus sp. FJAT-44742 TaxID=2014005 RepID=UPI000C24F29F|nr:ABC transporter permease [Bacillus sp. FJAT-44742]